MEAGRKREGNEVPRGLKEEKKGKKRGLGWESNKRERKGGEKEEKLRR